MVSRSSTPFSGICAGLVMPSAAAEAAMQKAAARAARVVGAQPVGKTNTGRPALLGLLVSTLHGMSRHGKHIFKLVPILILCSKSRIPHTHTQTHRMQFVHHACVLPIPATCDDV